MAIPYIRVVTIFTLVILMQSATAKRGCSAFGHSCFGGHGKRSFDMAPANDVASSEDGYGQLREFGQAETPAHPEYPQSGDQPAGDNMIPIRDGGLYEHFDNAPVKEMMKFRLRNIVKRWMDNYKKSQRTPDYGFIVD